MRSVVQVASAGSRPAVRLRPVLRYDPPFDDEMTSPAWSSARQPALEWPRPIQRAPSGPPPSPAFPPADPSAPADAAPSGQVVPTAAVPGAPAVRADAAPSDPAVRAGAAPNGQVVRPGAAPSGQAVRVGATPSGQAVRVGATPSGQVVRAGATPNGQVAGGAEVSIGPAVRGAAAPVVAGPSGDAKLAVKRFVHLCVEVLNGYRPATHLRGLSLPAEAAGVVAQGLAGARRVAQLRRARRPGDRRAQRPSPVGVLRVNLCEPRRGAVEAAVALVTGERTWAMALRLELHDDEWCATTLRLI
ncbi:Rv3235 family protein [Actinoplanes octamycinicus]|nr:Rv3235 family protein [Actinoplanes octamycinicus]